MARIENLPGEENAKARVFTPPSDGWCTIQAIETCEDAVAALKTPTNRYYWWDLEIVSHNDPEAIGKKFRYMATVFSNDSQTQAGGLHDFNQLAKAAGFSGYSQVGDTKELMFKPFRVMIKSTPQKNDPDRFNTNIRAWGFEDPDEKTEVGKSAPRGAAAGGAAAGGAASRGAGAAAGAGAGARSAPAGDEAAAAAGGSDWRSRAKG